MAGFGPSATRAALAAAACAVLAGSPSAAAAPSTDSGGYVNSTARCASPNTVVVFGSTETARIAICRMPDGRYEYRGVRVSDGARLIVAAEESTDGAFVADNDGIEYMVTAKSLVVSQGNKVLREDPMLDFHGQGAAAAQPATPAPTTPLPPPLPAERSMDE